MRCSDWEAPVLTPEQLEYAANDARTSLKLLLALYGLEHAPTRAPLAAWAIAAHDEVGSCVVGQSECSSQSGRAGQQARQPRDGYTHASRGGGAGGGGRAVRVPPRSKPLYDGWLMLGPDGEPMCRMATNRAEWYVRKGLAAVVAADDPLGADAPPGRCIRLLFEPNGRGNVAEPWLLQGKANVCVGCGSEALSGGDRHVRFGVVPHAFRRLLPAHMKSRDSHDIVLLCVGCYGQLESAYERQRATAFAKYGVNRQPNHAGAHDRQHDRIRSRALALVQHGKKLPSARRAVLHAELAMELGMDDASELTDAALAEIAGMTRQDCRRKQHKDAVPPEQKLLDAVVSASGGDEAALHAFVEGWRTLFVETLKPTHLPKGWRTDHRRAQPAS